MDIKFSENLKMLRIELGLSQIDLAKKMHTTQRKVSYWESGKIEPDLKSLWDLSDIFDVSIDFLIGKEKY